MYDKVKFDDFAKLDIRVGEIKKVENHPNADKLFVMRIDLGEKNERTVVAGLKKHYTANELRGKKAIFIANLEPVLLRGVESNGMILASSNEDKSKVRILVVDGDLAVGSKIS